MSDPSASVPPESVPSKAPWVSRRMVYAKGDETHLFEPVGELVRGVVGM